MELLLNFGPDSPPGREASVYNITCQPYTKAPSTGLETQWVLPSAENRSDLRGKHILPMACLRSKITLQFLISAGAFGEGCISQQN